MSSLTRSVTPKVVPTDFETFTALGLQLCDRVGFDEGQLYRLVGVGLSNFEI
ncbi:hypothetical protein [Acidipila sp. EB88]|uniref:DinB/UmuC family translesion DNA polymerase n=1 Tax=Acidipila sp. EB88 TaxID=2305226 RepID=UPI0035138E55